MILVDTSVWVDHLRARPAFGGPTMTRAGARDQVLADLLDAGQVLTHPFVIGELALGNLRQRDLIVGALRDLPAATVATDQEVLDFIAQHSLFGLGIGYVDAHLLAAVRLTAGSRLWTRDTRLFRVADRLGLVAESLP